MFTVMVTRTTKDGRRTMIGISTWVSESVHAALVKESRARPLSSLVREIVESHINKKKRRQWHNPPKIVRPKKKDAQKT